MAETTYRVYLSRLNGKRLLKHPDLAEKFLNLALAKMEELKWPEGHFEGEVIGKNSRTEGLRSVFEVTRALQLAKQSGGAKELLVSFITTEDCSLLLQAYKKPLEPVTGSTLFVTSNTPTDDREWKWLLAKCAL